MLALLVSADKTLPTPEDRIAGSTPSEMGEFLNLLIRLYHLHYMFWTDFIMRFGATLSLPISIGLYCVCWQCFVVEVVLLIR